MKSDKSLFITVFSDSSSWINRYIPTFIDKLRAHQCSVHWIHETDAIPQGDIAFYLGCAKILPLSILKRNHHNLVVHESALPHGRGWSPLTWQIIEGSHDIPIVVFEAEEKVDSGKIYLRDTMHFKGTELIEELRGVQAEYSFKLCIQFLEQYPDITTRGVKQEGQASYYHRRSPEDSRLDIDKTLREQFNLLRTVDNDRYPAFFEYDGQVYIIKITKK